MNAAAGQTTRVGVLVDPTRIHDIEDASWRQEDAVIEVADNLDGALGRLLERQPDVVLAAGDDAFVGRIVSAYEFGDRFKQRPLRIYPAAVGASSALARTLGADAFDPKLVRRLVKAARDSKLRRKQVSSLKVVVSSEPHARLGFSFGAGLFYRLFEAYKRAQTETSGRVAGTLLGLAKNTLLEGGRNLDPVSGKLTIDGEARRDTIGYLVASSLAETWLGLSMQTPNQHPGFRLGERGRELIKKVASSRALPRFVRSDEADGFERMDIDWSSGFVLDGELVEPGGAHALRIQAGPTVECVSLK